MGKYCQRSLKRKTLLFRIHVSFSPDTQCSDLVHHMLYLGDSKCLDYFSFTQKWIFSRMDPASEDGNQRFMSQSLYAQTTCHNNLLPASFGLSTLQPKSVQHGGCWRLRLSFLVKTDYQVWLLITANRSSPFSLYYLFIFTTLKPRAVTAIHK